MSRLNKFLKTTISFLLLLALISPTFLNNKIYAEEKIREVESLLSEKKESYDILIKFFTPNPNSDKKEIAKISQKEAISILEKGREEENVISYKSFYIVNGIHAVIKDENIIRKLINLDNVEKITINGKVTKIEPIKNNIRRRRSVIFVPDERKIEWGVSQIHADRVWEEFNITGKGVTVGIIDTGVNYNVPAIKKNFKGYDENTQTITNKEYYKDFIDRYDEPHAESINDHGTHVAGTILGKEGDKLNQIGVAPDAKFISARALDNNGGDTATLIEAGEWMLEQRPDVINNSWGGTNDNDDWYKEMAQAWRDAGIVAVFASGNSSSADPNSGLGSISNPGNLLNVFSVGAVDRNKNVGDFSKKGPSAFDESKKIIKPDVVAPGVQVRSVDATGKYVSWNGTSMATPHVVGVVALLKEADKSLTVEQIEKIIRETAEPITDKNFENAPNMAYGYGMINAYDAIASVKGRKMGSISGSVLKYGKDNEKAKAEILNNEDSYVGRDLKVSVRISDDISVKDAMLFYKSESDSSFSSEKLKLESGKQNDGVYEALIDAKYLKSGKLNLKVEVKDYAENITEVKKDISILAGVKIPWRENFEKTLTGFILDGRWKVTGKIGSDEPKMVDEHKKYIGIDGGKSIFDKRIESFMYLPPIDVSDLKPGEKLSISMNDYKGFTGISLAKIEVSTDNKNWELLHNVQIRPDFELNSRKWEFNSYDLSKYVGEKNPLLIRLYFLGHDADEGCGWYIDNISINKGDNKAPYKPQGLKGEINQKGLKISFKTVEVTDLKEYILERKDENGSFSEIKRFKNDERVEFVNNGKEKTYFKINFYDENVQNNKKYIYRVKAIDFFENESEYSNELEVIPKAYKSIVKYDFEENDGGFKTEKITGKINDFEYGKPQRPTDDKLDYNLREVWDGLEPLSKLWATKLNDVYSNKQDAYLLMPKFVVPIDGETYFYMDSFTTIPSVNITTLIVEIKDETNQWKTLFTKEEIQNPKTLRMWQTLEKSLEEYKGKEVEVRFHITSKNGIISNYELGWYIDNIFVGSKRQVFESKDDVKIEEKVHIFSGAYHNEKVNGIPVNAKITVLETGKYTFASEIDGSYKIGHSINEKQTPYTLRVEAYGYEPEEIKVDLSEKIDIIENFVLKKSNPTSFSGMVTDENGNPLENVNVKVVEDEYISDISTKQDGTFKMGDVYSGKYTIRFHKDGFEAVDVKVNLTKDEFKMDTVKLKSLSSLKSEIIDYKFAPKVENGSYQTVHFNAGMKGNAVRFQAKHKGSILKTADIFLVNNKYYSGNDIKVAVLGYDDEGRLTELAPFKTVKDVKPNSWNSIDFTEYNIKRDKPIYIATRYEKSLAESIGVFYDINASDEGKRKSFIYDGAFIKTSILPAYGAYAIKTTWLYENDAKENPETNFDESSSDPNEIGFTTEKEDVFVFDKDTRTIIGYKGNKTNLVIPNEIDSLEVKKIGAKAFDGTGKNEELKLKKVIIPDGVEEIGEGAFLNNNLSEIKLPESINKISKDAFKGQWKTHLDEKDRGLKVNIPKNIEVIKEGSFESSGSPLIFTGMENVKKIEKNAFSNNKDVEITAPNLEKIEDGAFGNKNSNFNYARIFTNNKNLISKEGEYLINPAIVKINMIDAKDSEKIFKIGLKYGKDNPADLKRKRNIDEFYKIGEKVEITPPKFTDNGNLYVSDERAVTLTLEKESEITFRYYKQAPEIRLPIFETDKEIVGFTLPDTKVKININGVEKEILSNDDGFFEIKDVDLKNIDKVSFNIGEKDALDVNVEKQTLETFVVKGNSILRYMGEDAEKLVIPNSVGNSLSIEEISDFAFYGKQIKNVILPDNVKTIGAGAFMNVGLKSFGWNLEDINKSALRTIKEYAFKDNEIEIVKLPELTHIIQTSAFENNRIKELELGKYTGHIGNKAFKNNKIKKITLPGGLEELGKEAFMKNELEEVVFLPPMQGAHSEGITEILENTFTNNNLKEIKLRDVVKEIDKTAFNENGIEKVKVFAENENLKAGINFVIVRKDGTVLEIKKEKKQGETKPSENENSDEKQKENPIVKDKDTKQSESEIQNQNMDTEIEDEQSEEKIDAIFSNEKVLKNKTPNTAINVNLYCYLTLSILSLVSIFILKKRKELSKK